MICKKCGIFVFFNKCYKCEYDINFTNKVKFNHLLEHFFKLSQNSFSTYISNNKLTKLNLIVWFIFCFPPAVILTIINIRNERVTLLSGILLILAIIIVLSIIKINKIKLFYKVVEPKITNLNYYKRELPDKLRPAHVRMLTSDGVIDGCSTAATILDLVDKGYLELSRCKSKEELFSNKEIIIRRTNKNIDDLFLYEKYLIEWILGNKKEVSQSEFQNNFENIKSAAKKYNEFRFLVMLSFPIDTYFEEGKNKKVKETLIMAAVFVCLIGVIVLFHVSGIISYIIFVLLAVMISLVEHATPVRVLNSKGAYKRGSWNSLKKFLSDFSYMKTKTSEEIILWNFYLTYSIALDINSVANKEIKKFFNEKDLNLEAGLQLVTNDTQSMENLDKLKKSANYQDVINEIKSTHEKELEKYMIMGIFEPKQYIEVERKDKKLAILKGMLQLFLLIVVLVALLFFAYQYVIR